MIISKNAGFLDFRKALKAFIVLKSLPLNCVKRNRIRAHINVVQHQNDPVNSPSKCLYLRHASKNWYLRCKCRKKKISAILKVMLKRAGIARFQISTPTKWTKRVKNFT